MVVEAAPMPGGHWLQVCVSDHGPGVDPARLQRIFEPFDRGTDSSGDGFGLALAIAQRAIALHGGSITALAAATGGLAGAYRVAPRQCCLKPAIYATSPLARACSTVMLTGTSRAITTSLANRLRIKLYPVSSM